MGDRSDRTSPLAWAGGAFLALVFAWLAFRILFGTLVLAFKLGFVVLLVAVIAFCLMSLGPGRGQTSEQG